MNEGIAVEMMHPESTENRKVGGEAGELSLSDLWNNI